MIKWSVLGEDKTTVIIEPKPKELIKYIENDLQSSSVELYINLEDGIVFNQDDIEWDNYLKKEKEVIRKFKSLKEANRTKELCEEVLGYDGNMLIYVPFKHKNPEMCLKAFEYGDFEEVFKGIPKEFLTEDFIIELIHINRRVTKLLPKELKTDKVMEVAGYRKKK